MLNCLLALLYCPVCINPRYYTCFLYLTRVCSGTNEVRSTKHQAPSSKHNYSALHYSQSDITESNPPLSTPSILSDLSPCPLRRRTTSKHVKSPYRWRVPLCASSALSGTWPRNKRRVSSSGLLCSAGTKTIIIRAYSKGRFYRNNESARASLGLYAGSNTKTITST